MAALSTKPAACRTPTPYLADQCNNQNLERISFPALKALPGVSGYAGVLGPPNLPPPPPVCVLLAWLEMINRRHVFLFLFWYSMQVAFTSVSTMRGMAASEAYHFASCFFVCFFLLPRNTKHTHTPSHAGGEETHRRPAPAAPVHPDGVLGGGIFRTRQENVSQKEEVKSAPVLLAAAAAATPCI